MGETENLPDRDVAEQRELPPRRSDRTDSDVMDIIEAIVFSASCA